jgi:hypothetical protein
MNKLGYFALGFATAFALPLTRAVIVGFQMGVANAKAEDEKRRNLENSILNYANVN